MAEELGYASRSDMKRKFDDSEVPPPRRQSGFSSAPAQEKTPLQSYNSVPPPMDEIEAAKQRAQAIAAKLFSDAEAKRPKTDNGSDLSGGNVFMNKFTSQPLPPAQVSTTSFASYNYHGSSKKIDIPNGRVGVIIGKGGDTIKYLQVQSGAKIQVTRDMDADPNSATRSVEIQGTPEQITKAEQLITDVLSQAEAGVSDLVAGRQRGPQQTGAEQFQMKIGNNKVGLVIGKGGETIKSMQAKSGARIQVIPLHLPPGDTASERTVYVDGTQEQIDVAKQLLNEILSETRVRNPSGGGYRAPRPQSNTWPPPSSQPSYNNYMQQPSAYPGAPPPQYNMPQQPQYPGYPPSSYQTGWDQSSNQSAQQQPAPGGYDYYSQQQPAQTQPTGASTVPPAPTDPNAYSYTQPPSYTSQGSYGDASAYSGGYSQPQAGYNYGGAVNYATPPSTKTPSQDGSTPNYSAPGGTTTNSTPQASPAQQPPASGGAPSQQAYSSQPPMTNPTSYPAQAYPPVPTQPGYSTGQPGYGQTGYGQRPPQPQPVYGQGPPAGSAQTGYTQPGYPHGQAVPPQSGYGTGYGGYGQYSESYGGAGSYGQAPAAAYSKESAAAQGTGTGAPAGVAQAAPGGGAPVAGGSKSSPS